MRRYDLPKAAPYPLTLVQQFLNTVDAEHGREWLETPADLEVWFREHGVEIEGPPIVHAELRRALDVREALRALTRANNGEPVSPEAISTLNHAFRAARLEFVLDPSGAPAPKPAAHGLDGGVGVVLGTFVEAYYGGVWRRLKACRNCRWVFYDYSSNRSARWCSMALCGNRSKTRAYRGRKRTGRGRSQ